MKKTGQPDYMFARNEGERIAYYRADSTSEPDLWDSIWEEKTSRVFTDYYDLYTKGFLGRGQLPRVFLKYLPQKGLILEGGCGMGQYVIALRARGYNCIGIDFAKKTIERIKQYFPDLPVEAGDVCSLSLTDNSLDAYISLGVVEHFQKGPHDALLEAARVLKPGGVLLVSVPHAFKWRRLTASPEGTELPEEAVFYQYAFTPSEFREILETSGFSVIAEYGYETHFAFRIKYRWFRNILGQYPRIRHLDLLLDRIPLVKNLARMHVYIATRNSD